MPLKLGFLSQYRKILLLLVRLSVLFLLFPFFCFSISLFYSKYLMIIFVYLKYLYVKIDSPAKDRLIKLYLTLDLSKVVRYMSLIGFLGLLWLVNV